MAQRHLVGALVSWWRALDWRLAIRVVEVSAAGHGQRAYAYRIHQGATPDSYSRRVRAVIICITLLASCERTLMIIDAQHHDGEAHVREGLMVVTAASSCLPSFSMEWGRMYRAPKRPPRSSHKLLSAALKEATTAAPMLNI
jgi:hypothetical protein